ARHGRGAAGAIALAMQTSSTPIPRRPTAGAAPGDGRAGPVPAPRRHLVAARGRPARAPRPRRRAARAGRAARGRSDPTSPRERRDRTRGARAQREEQRCGPERSAHPLLYATALAASRPAGASRGNRRRSASVEALQEGRAGADAPAPHGCATCRGGGMEAAPPARRAGHHALALGAAVALAGCAVGPDYARPPRREGAAGHEPLQGALSGASADPDTLASWWKQLDDPLLDDLVARAVAGNLDVRAAHQRVRESRAHRDVAEAALYPTLKGRVVLSPAEPDSSTARQATALQALSTLDACGALRRGVEASHADLRASHEDLHEALVNLAAAVVETYIDVRALQARIAIAEQNLEAQTETARIATWRAQAGLTTVLDVERADTNVEQTRSQVPGLRA